jgi:hypothetical protein
MESHTLSTMQTKSTHGTLKPHLNVSDLTMQSPNQLASTTTLSPNSLIGFQCGDPCKVQDPVKQLPMVEEILAAEAPPPRTLRIKHEEFYQWRQVLGAFQKNVQSTIKDAYK